MYNYIAVDQTRVIWPVYMYTYVYIIRIGIIDSIVGPVLL